MRDGNADTSIARGAFFLVAASGIFLISSYAIHFGLGRYLGPEDYGAFGVVLALMTSANLLVATGIPQATSKHISESTINAKSVAQLSLRIQLAFTLVVFALYVGLADLIAHLLGDPGLGLYIRLSGLVVPFYALYSLYCDGYLNGLRKFGYQALSSVVNSLSKVALVFAFVLIGLSVRGAILGYAGAAILAWLVALKYVGPHREGGPPFEWTQLAKFAVPTTLFFTSVSLIIAVDLLAVQAIVNDEVETGLYTSATTIAKIPYFLFTGLALTLLPSISMSTSSSNTELTTSYIRQSTRYMLMLLLPVAAIVSATSRPLISLLYSTEYAAAAGPLSILIFGLTFFSIFFVLCHIIMGSGKPIVALGIALPLVIMSVAMNWILISAYGLSGAAWATTATAFVGMSTAAWYVLRRFKTLVSAKSLLKICLSSAVLYVVALQIDPPLAALPVVYIGMFLLYLGLLFIMREFNSDDRASLRKIVPLSRFRD